MADKTPVRVVFNASNVATGMAEFQTGESVPIANGGTGLTAIGSAGQIIKVNAAGNALEFGAEGDLSITNLVAPTNADLTLTTSGTGNIVLDALTVRGTTISSADSGTININDNVEIDGNLVVTGTVDFNDQNISNVGSLSIDSISGDADTNTSITFSGSDVITIATGGSGRLTVGDSALSPVTDSQIDLGTSSLYYKDAYIDSITTTGNVSVGGNLDVTGTLDLSDSNFTNVGSLQLDSIAGDGDTNTSITFSGSDVITIATGGSGRLTIGDGALSPVTDNQIDLGTSSLEFKDAFFDGTVTSDAFAGPLTGDVTGNVSGTAATVTGAAQSNITSLGTLTTLTVDNVIINGTTIGHTSDTDAISIGSDGDITLTQDLELQHDGAILSFGTNDEIALTHVHDTGLLLTDSGGTPTLQLHDSNESVSSDGTNLIFTSGGTAFKMPIADGNNGDFLKTDGAGTMSFASSVATPSDDTRVVVKNNKSVSTSARTVDYFQSTSADLAWYFVALNDLTNDHSSASCFAVAHNNSDAFISGPRGGASGSDNSLPSTTADISSGQVRVKITAPSADSKISYYKIPISRANTADATAGVTITTSNTDVDSDSEVIDTFAHASFRAAKYLIIIDDNAKTETGITEALVVHDGTTAFVTQYGTVNTGNNDMITLSAQIVSANVVLSAAGLASNLSLKIHKTLLSDSMSAVSNANQKIIGATTVSSSATAFDSFDLDDATAALYYVVGGNASEGAFSVQEVFCAGAPGEASVVEGTFVSTKGTHQLSFTAAFDADEDNTLQMSVASTSGGSTTVNAYRINCLAE
jgi:hypothetical protein